MPTLELGRRMALLFTQALLALAIATPVASAQTLKTQAATEGRITIGVHNRWPWGLKADDGGVTGLYPDVMKAVAGPLGVKQVDFVVMDFGALVPSLLSKRIDAVASGMGITPARCAQVIFSEPFQANGDAALVKKGNPLNIHSFGDIARNPAIRVADIRGASTTEHAVADGVAKDRFQFFQDYEAGVAALMAGRVDAMFMTTATANGLLRDPKISGLERAAPFVGLVRNGREEKTFGAIAFRPEDAEFRDMFNKSLAQKLADGTLERLLVKYDFSKNDVPPKDLTAKVLCEGNYR
jgi:polar amino acid transport system substrate-binding protein